MSQHASDGKHAAHSIKPYLIVFGALMVLTVITVSVSHLNLPKPWGLVVGLSIAAVKASLVALFFMHLLGERALIWSILGLSAVFCVVLFSIPAFDSQDNFAVGRAARQPVVMDEHEHGSQDAQQNAEESKSSHDVKPVEKKKASKKKAGAH